MGLCQRLALLRGAADRRRGDVGGRERGDHGGGFGGRRAARAKRVAGFFLHPDRVSHVAGRHFIGLFARAGDGRAAAAFAVAPQPLVGEAGGCLRPGSPVLGQRLALLRGAGDLPTRRASGRERGDHGGGFGGRRPARATRVAGSLLHPERVAHVSGRWHVGLAGGAGDVRAAGAFAVALLPLVAVARGAVAPFAVLLGERLALLRGAGDARRRRVGGRRARGLGRVARVQRHLVFVDGGFAKRVAGTGGVAVGVVVA